VKGRDYFGHTGIGGENENMKEDPDEIGVVSF
jgi:hypothetical protein